MSIESILERFKFVNGMLLIIISNIQNFFFWRNVFVGETLFGELYLAKLHLANFIWQDFIWRGLALPILFLVMASSQLATAMANKWQTKTQTKVEK